MSDVPKPYHVWPSNRDFNRPASLDYCTKCGVRRFSDDPDTIAKAEGPCPGTRSA